ncbi:MAG: esterase [Planctomycetota bacterium]|nr:MAG: esterase [Planctomycetota bacterium]REK42241.1 MAG: esterase [Planctomycetota bacterium]
MRGNSTITATCPIIGGVMGGWTEIEVAGHPCDLFEPEAPSEHGYTVIYLHGVNLNRLVDNAEFTRLFDAHGLRVLAPTTQRSWWTDKICVEFDEQLTAERHVRENVLGEIAARFDAQPPRIALLGTSMGGQGALRLAIKYPDTFPIAAGISPAIDYQTRLAEGDEALGQMYPDPESARQDTATLHIHPLYWPRHMWFSCDPEDYRWHESSERFRMKLSALGVPHTCDLETSGGGHGFEYYNRMAETAIGFIANALDRERLRVV